MITSTCALVCDIVLLGGQGQPRAVGLPRGLRLVHWYLRVRCRSEERVYRGGTYVVALSQYFFKKKSFWAVAHTSRVKPEEYTHSRIHLDAFCMYGFAVPIFFFLLVSFLYFCIALGSMVMMVVWILFLQFSTCKVSGSTSRLQQHMIMLLAHPAYRDEQEDFIGKLGSAS